MAHILIVEDEENIARMIAATLEMAGYTCQSCMDGSKAVELVQPGVFDLVLLDIKHYTPQGFQAVTGRDTGEWREFLSQLQAQEVPLWIRHVVVPGLTDGDEHLQGLLGFVSTLHHVRRVELLPYHTLGVHKYHTLGYPYPLEGVEPLAKDALAGWQEKFDRAFPHIL